MYDVDYHRMMTLVERTPDNNALRLEQSLTVVMDAKRSRQGTDCPTRCNRSLAAHVD